MADIWSQKMALRSGAFGNIAQALAQLAQQKRQQEEDASLQNQFPLMGGDNQFNVQNLLSQLNTMNPNNPLSAGRINQMSKAPSIAQQFQPQIEQRDPYKQTISRNPLTGKETVINDGMQKQQYDTRTVVGDDGKPTMYDVGGIKFIAQEKYDTNTGKTVPNTVEFKKTDDLTFSPFAPQTMAFNQESSLRKEFGSKPIVQDYTDLRSKYLVAKEAYNKAVTTGNASAADQALITMFNKMTDPQSVVRESEYARTPQNVAVVNRAKGAFERLSTGGSGITNADRKAILDMAELAYKSYEKLYNQEKKRYSDLAKRKKIDPRDIVGDEEQTTKTNQTADPLGIR